MRDLDGKLKYLGTRHGGVTHYAGVAVVGWRHASTEYDNYGSLSDLSCNCGDTN